MAPHGPWRWCTSRASADASLGSAAAVKLRERVGAFAEALVRLAQAAVLDFPHIAGDRNVLGDAGTGAEKFDLLPRHLVDIGEHLEPAWERAVREREFGLGRIDRGRGGIDPLLTQGLGEFLPVAVIMPHSVWLTTTISVVPKKLVVRSAERMASSVTSPPALRKMWASPSRSPSACSIGKRSSMHARTHRRRLLGMPSWRRSAQALFSAISSSTCVLTTKSLRRAGRPARK